MKTFPLDYRIEDLLKKHHHSSHFSDFFRKFGLSLIYVGREVLRPDCSYVSKYLTLWLIENYKIYEGKRILEIGCGCGIQSLTMGLMGASKILATDISEYAVNSCTQNKNIYNLSSIIEVRRGDLFRPIDSHEKFDFVVFNHPFFDGKPKRNMFEYAILDDRELAGIFLENVWRYLNPGGIVLMPYSCICGQKNNPIRFAQQLNIFHKIQFEKSDQDGSHLIIAFANNIN